MTEKILITGRSFRLHDGPHRQVLLTAGYELLNSPQDRPLRPAELEPLVDEVIGVILGVDNFTAEVFTHAPHLKVISRCGVGLDGVDLLAATQHGVVVTITPGANSIGVAELTIGLMLTLARQIPAHNNLVKQGQWSRTLGLELAGTTLGLVGLGSIGRKVARRAMAFGMQVLYYDPMPPDPKFVTEVEAEARSLTDLLGESDIVSLHLPLMSDTRNLIGPTGVGGHETQRVFDQHGQGGTGR